MKNQTLLAASCPSIITKGGNPRVNKEEINSIFLKKYTQIFGELLKVKGKIEELNITYIGGHNKEKSISRAKLYISAYNYYLNSLGYTSLSKNNLTVLDETNIEENLENIEKCDLLFLGVGCDKTFNSAVEALENKGINLKKLINERNIVTNAICSGSVMTAKQIYGGMYDVFYYDKENYEYPVKLRTLDINPVTLETNFNPTSQTPEKNKEYIEKYLKPDSKRIVFFACKPNNFVLISENKIFSYGEVYLFIDGYCLEIGSQEEKIEITKLVELVNNYNTKKNRQNFLDNKIFAEIKNEIQKLNKLPIVTTLELEEKEIIEAFRKKENKIKDNKKEELKKLKEQIINKYNLIISDENLTNLENNKKLQQTLLSLNSKLQTNSLKELYIKLNIISILKKAYNDYLGYYTEFQKDLYTLLNEIIEENESLPLYILNSCGSIFTNSELKKLLKKLKLEIELKPSQIIKDSEPQLKFFKKEIKYERS